MSAVILGVETWTLWKLLLTCKPTPEIDFSEVSDITLGDVMCDGCEDDLAELRAEDAAIDRSWEAYYQNLQEGETGED